MYPDIGPRLLQRNCIRQRQVECPLRRDAKTPWKKSIRMGYQGNLVSGASQYTAKASRMVIMAVTQDYRFDSTQRDVQLPGIPG